MSFIKRTLASSIALMEARYGSSDEGRTAEEVAFATRWSAERRAAAAAGVLFVMLPAILAVPFAATPRNLAFPWAIGGAQSLAAAFIAFAALALFRARLGERGSRAFANATVLLMTVAVVFLAVLVQAYQDRAADLAARFPDVPGYFKTMPGRSVTEARGFADMGVVALIGLIAGAIFGLPAGRRTILILSVAYAALLIWVIGERSDRLYLALVSFPILVAAASNACLRFARLRREGYLELERQRLKERESVLKYEHEIELARKLQASMAPPRQWLSRSSVNVQSYSTARHRLGGDWLAVQETKAGELVLVASRVVGGGLHAALVAHSIQSIWALAAHAERFEPTEFLAQVNAALVIMGERERHIASMGLVVIADAKVRYWSAGFGPLCVVTQGRDGPLERMVGDRGRPLGEAGTLDAPYGEATLDRDSAADVLFGSDGIFAALARSGRQAIALLEQMRRHGVEAVEQVTSDDDRTMLWAHYNPELRS